MEARTLYRLLVLYMIKEADEPLSNTKITAFVLDQEYTNYFVLQQTISDLIESGLIRPEPVHGNTLYHLTDDGRQTLGFFEDKISDQIRADVKDFLTGRGLSADGQPFATARYVKNADNQYTVTCQIKNKDRTLLSLALTVPEETQADAIRVNWEEQFVDVYASVMDLLLF